MRYLKLGLVVATAALAAFGGVSTASATTLTGSSGKFLPAGTEIHAVLDSGQVSTLTTVYKNIVCEESTIQGKTANESGAVVSVSVEALTFGKCNCEVKVISGGTISISLGGVVASNGTEVTTSCITVFGSVHCIYKTSATTLGTLTGGTTATMDIEGANIPRLATDVLCAEKANWDTKYLVTSPDTLKIDP